MSRHSFGQSAGISWAVRLAAVLVGRDPFTCSCYTSWGSKCQFLKERSFSEKWKSLICVVCPNTTAARSHKKKKAIENKKNQNIKVTMEKYIIDWVKLTICRTNFGHTQNGRDPVCRDQIDLRQFTCLF